MTERARTHRRRTEAPAPGDRAAPAAAGVRTSGAAHVAPRSAGPRTDARGERGLRRPQDERRSPASRRPAAGRAGSRTGRPPRRRRRPAEGPAADAARVLVAAAARRPGRHRHGAVAVRRTAPPAAGFRLLRLRRLGGPAHPHAPAAALAGHHHRPQRPGARLHPARRRGHRRPDPDHAAGRRDRRRALRVPRDARRGPDAAADQARHPLRLPEEEGAGAHLQRPGRRPGAEGHLRRLPRERPDPHLPRRLRRLVGGRLRRRRRQGPGRPGARARTRSCPGSRAPRPTRARPTAARSRSARARSPRRRTASTSSPPSTRSCSAWPSGGSPSR